MQSVSSTEILSFCPDVVDLKIEKELLAGRLSGPFEMPPLSPFRVSPLRVIPKKTPGEFRHIHHLSYPKGSSVNDGIFPNFLVSTMQLSQMPLGISEQLARGAF